jgi:hypothetical protein
MTKPSKHPEQDPAEGFRETIERQLDHEQQAKEVETAARHVNQGLNDRLGRDAATPLHKG